MTARIGIGGAELKRRERAAAKRFDESFKLVLDNMPTRTACLFCGDQYEGTALEGRAWAETHRLEYHPQAQRRRKAKRAGHKWNSANLTIEQEEKMAVDRERRMRIFGISAEPR